MRSSVFQAIIVFSAFLLVAGTAMAATVSYDFDTDQSSSFVVQEYLGPDSSIDWAYDYSTHTQVAPATDVPIISAPNSSSTTLGVRIDVNLTLTAINSVTLYPDVSSLNMTGDWRMTFDVWGNHNGDEGGDSGSTEFYGWGAQADTTGPGVGSDGSDGFNYIWAADGGSSVDARYSSGSGTMAIDNAVPAWWGDGANVNFNFNQPWMDFFVNDGTLGTPPAGTIYVGAPGKQWVTIRLTVTNSGADREVAIKRSGDADFTVVSTITGGAGSAARPCIGYADYFTSLANPAADQFVVFDNLVITDDLNVDGWTNY